jgi:hypothetical protein
MQGSLKKYRAIAAATVARAMLAIAKTDSTGVHRYSYAAMKEKAGSLI